MESETRGEPGVNCSTSRPAIARRSCDQCRTRKIGCDRGTPCSHCINARLSCTHSTIASKVTGPKQRILISSQYEQKIDGIAKDIDEIKRFLEQSRLPLNEHQTTSRANSGLTGSNPSKQLNEYQDISPSSRETFSEHSTHIVDFLKNVLRDGGLGIEDPESSEILTSLRGLVQVLEGHTFTQPLNPQNVEVLDDGPDPTMPPLDVAVEVSRWAMEHESNTTISWLSFILPLQNLTDICRKVYFAVEDYAPAEFILANGFLAYAFFESAISTGRQDYRTYCNDCREILQRALSRLPLVLPASMEMTAALALGAFDAIETSKPIRGWTFISAAANMCQTLGYHRVLASAEVTDDLSPAQERLFWSVYRMDKGISVQLGRASNIQDAVITRPIDPSLPRYTRLARLQSKVYDHLYSPAALAWPGIERGYIAKVLATESRQILSETQVEILDALSQPDQGTLDPMRLLHLRSDMVCQSGLLTLITRAIPVSGSFGGSVSEECIVAARETLKVHEQCLTAADSVRDHLSMVARYINWALMRTPFTSFSVLFTRAIQMWDVDELARLERFADSLQPLPEITGCITHRHRLYKLLCQAARLYFEMNGTSLSKKPTSMQEALVPLGNSEFAPFGRSANDSMDAFSGTHGGSYDLSDWYYENQQMMSLLDDNVV